MKKSKTKKTSLTKSVKAELQKKIASASLKGPVAITEADLKTLGLLFGKKNSIVCSFDEVLFICYKTLNQVTNEYEYFVHRKLDKKTKAHAVSLVDETQAKAIGLHEGIKKLKIGDEVFDIHYVSADAFPTQFKKFALKEKAPVISDDRFLTHFMDADAADKELNIFFDELRNWKKQITDKVLETKEVEKVEPKVVKQPSEKLIDITELSTPKKVSADSVTYSDAFNIRSVQKTGYHYLADNELIFVREPKTPRSELSFSYQTNFRDVDNFWSKLVKFYNINAVDLDRKLDSLEKHESPTRVFDTEQAELKITSKTKSAEESLEPKRIYLEEERDVLHEKVESLRLILETNQIPLDDSVEYKNLVQKYEETVAELDQVNKAIEIVNTENQTLSQRYQNFVPRNYTKVNATTETLNRHQDFVIDKLSNFDQQLNDIEYRKKEFEELLYQRVVNTHKAKKAKAKFELELRAQKPDNSELLLIAEREQEHLNQLAEQGRIQENIALVQAQIDLDESKINNSIETLREFEVVDNYEERIKNLHTQQQSLKERQVELNDVLVGAKIKLLKRRKLIKEDLKKRSQSLMFFENEIYQLSKKLNEEIRENFEVVWKLWNGKGISEINEIFTKKIELLTQISEVVAAQIDRLSINQMQSLELAKENQIDWEKVYEEVVNEYKVKGFYQENPKIEEFMFDNNQTKQNPFVRVELAPAVEKIVNLDYALSLADTQSRETYLNDQAKLSLLGLNPVTKDDDEYLVIDQLHENDELTPEQQSRLEQAQLERRLLEEEQMAKEAEVVAAQVETERELEAEMARVRAQKEQIDREIAAENAELERKLRQEEADALAVAQVSSEIHSKIVSEHKKEVYHFAKNLITEKYVELNGKNLVITDQFEPTLPQSSQRLQNLDYLAKPEDLSFQESNEVLDLEPFEEPWTNSFDNPLADEAPLGPELNIESANEQLEAFLDQPVEIEPTNLDSQETQPIETNDDSLIDQLNQEEFDLSDDLSSTDFAPEQNNFAEFSDVDVISTEDLLGDNVDHESNVTEDLVTLEDLSGPIQRVESEQQPASTEDFSFEAPDFSAFKPEDLVDESALAVDENQLDQQLSLIEEENEIMNDDKTDDKISAVFDDLTYREPAPTESEQPNRVSEIDLSEIKKRIMQIDEEILHLSSFTERSETRVEQAVKLRDELKRQFDEQMEIGKLEFEQSRDEFNNYLKSEIDEINEENTFDEAIEKHLLEDDLFAEPTAHDEVVDKDTDPSMPELSSPENSYFDTHRHTDQQDESTGELDQEPTDHFNQYDTTDHNHDHEPEGLADEAAEQNQSHDLTDSSEEETESETEPVAPAKKEGIFGKLKNLFGGK
ncbi:hypothetical protein J2Z62_000682 [Mycoplasmoides fastidiosum]|uniref:Uncharacterized protein n=1 Tax=Mycoplasmoides fastidiosum TaxID=92758 RepID=A0ABU0LZX4_9BACT|nr:hypothetical protein [Mycoplasmoides fastidiosum]MDQ0514244.1 hypothetical protein [Mycoplasmoides fastidiosum]UUD37348.1 hypothetical protein NPA10_02065 [Mycoplasmoides fastidiosum]